jgi:hypothetical protein
MEENINSKETSEIAENYLKLATNNRILDGEDLVFDVANNKGEVEETVVKMKDIKDKAKAKINDETESTIRHIVEHVKIGQNATYGIEKYIKPIRRLTSDGTGLKLFDSQKKFWNILLKHHYGNFIASRQTGKTTAMCAGIAVLMHAVPNLCVLHLNKDLAQAIENLRMVNEYSYYLPSWLKKTAVHSQRSYELLSNGSFIKTEATGRNPYKVGRGLTVNIFWADEVAYIYMMDEAYTSFIPATSKSFIESAKLKMPYFIAVTSTPNGKNGMGKWYWELFRDSEQQDIWFKDPRPIDTNEPYFEGWNGFITQKMHWTEVPEYDEKWYRGMCRKLKNDKRKINQELELAFLGGDNALFEDELIQAMIPQEPLFISRM